MELQEISDKDLVFILNFLLNFSGRYYECSSMCRSVFSEFLRRKGILNV